MCGHDVCSAFGAPMDIAFGAAAILYLALKRDSETAHQEKIGAIQKIMSATTPVRMGA
jgi:hypothetical protein